MDVHRSIMLSHEQKHAILFVSLPWIGTYLLELETILSERFDIACKTWTRCRPGPLEAGEIASIHNAWERSLKDAGEILHVVCINPGAHAGGMKSALRKHGIPAAGTDLKEGDFETFRRSLIASLRVIST